MLRRENRFERTARSLARLLPLVVAFSCLVFFLNTPAAQASHRTRTGLTPAFRLCLEPEITTARPVTALTLTDPGGSRKSAFTFSIPACGDHLALAGEASGLGPAPTAHQHMPPSASLALSGLWSRVLPRGPPAI